VGGGIKKHFTSTTITAKSDTGCHGKNIAWHRRNFPDAKRTRLFLWMFCISIFIHKSLTGKRSLMRAERANAGSNCDNSGSQKPSCKKRREEKQKFFNPLGNA